jgi:hypothetical protein
MTGMSDEQMISKRRVLMEHATIHRSDEAASMIPGAIHCGSAPKRDVAIQ